MNAMSGTLVPASLVGGMLSGSGRDEPGQTWASAMSLKWSALHDAAGVVAMLAGLPAEPIRPELSGFPAVMHDAGTWRRVHAERGIDDLSAVMVPGLAALLAVSARGGNPGAAALALWQEFDAARAALLLLAPPPGEASPGRFG